MPKKPTLFVVGDSTVSAFSDNYYMPRTGWGEGLKYFFDENIRIENLAVSGTSSKSFRSHKNYETFLNGISEGDYLIIGFGHNDEKRGEVTFTDPVGDFRKEGSFSHSLFEGYIKPASDKGLGIVLVTPIVRRDETHSYIGEKVHVTSDGDYAEAIRRLSKDLERELSLSVLVCDLTRETRVLSLKVDTDDEKENDTLFMHARTGKREISCDDTHTNLFGAVVNAYLIAEDIKKAGIPLSLFLKKEYDDPLSKAAYWVKRSVNLDYKEPVYESPKELSDFWPPFLDQNKNRWYATVFGDINDGDCRNTKSFSFSGGDGKIHIGSGLDRINGKVTEKSDGIAMYFLRLPADQAFCLKAKVRLDSYNTAKGPADSAAFGLMVRDDIYINEASGELLGDYVSAGIIFNPSHPKGANTFARRSGRLVFEGGELRKAPHEGDELSFCIESTTDGYRAAIEGYSPVSTGYDLKLTAIDPDFIYIGFFAARSVSITVSDIIFERT